MSYVTLVLFILSLSIIIHLKGWRKGIMYTFVLLLMMTLLAWLEDTIFDNSTIITVIFILISGFIYERFIRSRKEKDDRNTNSQPNLMPSKTKSQKKRFKAKGKTNPRT